MHDIHPAIIYDACQRFEQRRQFTLKPTPLTPSMSTGGTFTMNRDGALVLGPIACNGQTYELEWNGAEAVANPPQTRGLMRGAH